MAISLSHESGDDTYTKNEIVVVLQVVGLKEHEIVWEGWLMQEAGHGPISKYQFISSQRKLQDKAQTEVFSLVKERRCGYAAPGMPAEWWQLGFSIL